MFTLFLITVLLGSIYLDLSLLSQREYGKYFSRCLVLLGINTVGAIVSWWWFHPAFIGPLGGIFNVVWQPLLINAVISGIAWYRREENSYKADYTTVFAIVITVAINAGFWLIFGVINPAVNNQALRAKIEDNLTIVEDVPPGADTDRIQVMREPSARQMADNVMGNPIASLNISTSSSIFKLGTPTQQEIPTSRGLRDVFIYPLEYRDFPRNVQVAFSPGYVIVDSENQNIPPMLVDRYQIRYLETGFWDKQIDRYIYTHGYENYSIWKKFMVDDEGAPYWVATLIQPTVGITGDEVRLVVIVDAQFGKIEEYDDINKLPAWVERVLPEDVIEDRYIWWGNYVHGWWNSWWGERDVIEPVPVNEEEVDAYITHHNGITSYVIGFTSKGDEDAALAGVMYTDARTGHNYFYKWVPAGKTPPAITNEQDCYEAFTTALGITGGAMVPDQCMLYTLYGRQVWVAPIKAASNDELQGGIGLYDAELKYTVLDFDKMSGGPKEDMLAAYRQWLEDQGTDVDAPEGGGELIIVEGVVQDIMPIVVAGNTFYKIVIDKEPLTVFEARDSVSPWLWRTKPGHTIRIEYNRAYNTTTGEPETVQPVTRFRNLTIMGEAAAIPTSTITPTSTLIPTATPTPTVEFDP